MPQRRHDVRYRRNSLPGPRVRRTGGPAVVAKLSIRQRLVPGAGLLRWLRYSFSLALIGALLIFGWQWFTQPFGVGALEFTPHVVGQATSAVGVLGVAAADIDGDGDKDIVTAGKDDLKLYENTGSATFEMKIIDGIDGERVQVVDLDKDGDKDLLVTLSGSSSTVRWYQQTTAREFEGTAIGTGTAGKAYAGDLNADGAMDIVTALTQAEQVVLSRWMNNGSGTFVETQLSANSKVTALTVGDIDGNGYADIVTGGEDGLQRWQTSDGVTFSRSDLDDSNDNKTSIAIADMNADNRQDIVTGDQVANAVAVYHNQDNAFWKRSQLEGDADAVTVAPADLDEDGDGDVVVAAQDDNSVLWYEDVGDSGSKKRTIATKLQSVFGVAVADIDGDGDLDVITADHFRGTVYWYERLLAKPKATAPTNITQSTDASGKITFETTLSDGDRDPTRIRVQYSVDGDHWYKPWLTKVTPASGSVDLKNSNGYQVGTNNAIDTDANDSVKLTLIWDTKSVENTGGPIVGDVSTVQVRIIPRDSRSIGAVAISKEFRVDNEAPQGLSGLTIDEINEDAAGLSWEQPTDSATYTYAIYYGTDQTAVLEKRSEVWDGDDDESMNDVETTSTVIDGLEANKAYTFKIFAKDEFGNETAGSSVRGKTVTVSNEEDGDGDGTLFVPSPTPSLSPAASPDVPPSFAPSPSISASPTPSPSRSPTSVLDGNTAPVADAGVDQVVNPSALVILDGTASADVEGDALLYFWKQIDGTSVRLSSDDTATPSFSVGEANATYIFSLTVKDFRGASAFDTVTIATRELPAAPATPVEVGSTTPIGDEEVPGSSPWLDWLKLLDLLLFAAAAGSTVILMIERLVRALGEGQLKGPVPVPVTDRGGPLGRVVHYQTGEPIAGAQVLIYDREGKLRATERTNASGDFSTFFPAGQYRIDVTVNGFVMASTAALSSKLENGLVYTGGTLTVQTDDAPPRLIIPMRPTSVSIGSLRASSLRVWQIIQRLGRLLSWPLFLVGALLNTILLFINPSLLYLVIEILYVGLVIMKIALELKVRPAYGFVRDAITHVPLDLVVVRLFDAKTNRLVMTRVTNTQGKFFALPPAGQYTVTMAKQGYAAFSKQNVVITDEQDAVLQMTADLMPVAPQGALAAVRPSIV